ncbi:hypothetical protein D1815_15550 [Aquimarina sp. AD1]|uniref:hypothetical protein n=1 Tax=Aquimarina sp. (strain AD1) TaxID=1714848 RepID=UPI000E4FDB6F|nr:hypothetical protein [Aquimarina sp. AD1]AXT57091.1 hypothetical protein D1815_15550 [Aquimarina sp. AD1]RKN23247.1 hypothetical protein D7035_11465 [Aquimarina sp. AD1]
MSENNFIISSLIYLAIAIWLTFSFGPSLIRKGKEINKNTLLIENLDKVSINLKVTKRKIIFNGKEYDSLPIVNSYKLKQNIDKKLELIFYKDTLEIYSLLNSKSESYKKIIAFLEKNNVLQEKDLTKKSNLEIVGSKTDFIKHIEVSNKILNTNKKKIDYLKINNTIIKGRDKKLQSWAMILGGYITTIVSGVGLLLIPFSMYHQIKDHRESGTKMFIPNKLEGIKRFFRIFKNK